MITHIPTNIQQMYSQPGLLPTSSWGIHSPDPPQILLRSSQHSLRFPRWIWGHYVLEEGKRKRDGDTVPPRLAQYDVSTV